MKVEQFVMAYRVEQDRIRAMLPDGFVSLRPVLRINTEIRQSDDGFPEADIYRDGDSGRMSGREWRSLIERLLLINYQEFMKSS